MGKKQREKQKQKQQEKVEQASNYTDQIATIQKKDFRPQQVIDKSKEQFSKEEKKISKTHNGQLDENIKQNSELSQNKKQKKNKNKNNKRKREQEDSVQKEVQIQKKAKQNTENAINLNEQVQEQEQQIKYPYEVDDDDHCETPFEAYVHIKPLLDQIATNLGKSSKDLSIYDPYYCQGRMREHLKKIGFENVYNKKEDFYKVIENNALPQFDVLITNPPYSEEHIQKILTFCVTQKKPWFLLVPNFVYTKDWYLQTLKKSEPWTKPFYLTPNQRYFYLKDGKQTSPFISFWYNYLGQQQNDIIEQCRLVLKLNCEIVKNLQKLPQNMKDSNDPTRKKLRKNQREAKKKKVQQHQQHRN